jgi:hypothetical protein
MNNNTEKIWYMVFWSQYVTMKCDKELLLGANSITEAMHISAVGLYEEVEDKSKVDQVCAW